MKDISIKEFFHMLEAHDWYFDFSDDGRVWRRGQENIDKIRGIASKDPLFERMLQDFRNYYFRGRPWGNEQGPKPELSNYLETRDNG